MKKGDRVVVEPRPEWGVGQVLTDPSNGKVEVYFVNAGPKVMSLSGPLKLVTGAEAANKALDNLPANLRKDGSQFTSLVELQRRFLNEFPGGFAGEKYSIQERNYKMKAHLSAKEILERRRFEAAISDGNVSSLCDEIKSNVITNLIFTNEQIKLSYALKDRNNQAKFCERLFELLFGVEALEKRFVAFCKLLGEMDSAKWTIATYFLFIFYPSEHMFLKPLVTERAADICHFQLNYRPQLNWLTYQKLQDFSKYLLTELSELKPRDMIDVQSFIWLTGEQQTKEAT